MPDRSSAVARVFDAIIGRRLALIVLVPSVALVSWTASDDFAERLFHATSMALAHAAAPAVVRALDDHRIPPSVSNEVSPADNHAIQQGDGLRLVPAKSCLLPVPTSSLRLWVPKSRTEGAQHARSPPNALIAFAAIA